MPTTPNPDLADPDRSAAALLLYALNNTHLSDHDTAGLRRLADHMGRNGGNLPATAAALAAAAAELIQPHIDSGAVTLDDVKAMIGQSLGQPARVASPDPTQPSTQH